MSEPYLAHPVSPMEAATIGLAAAAVPVISAVIISRVVNGIVDVFVPLDERKERDKFYKHTHKVIKDSSLPATSSTLYIKEVENSPSESIEDEELGDEWTDHVERAKAELDTAHKKVRCGKCKKDIEEVKNNLETRTSEMVRNAKKHKVMTTLQKQGKINPGKTWKQLTPNEKKMIKLIEA
jgi:hypothetical protein